MGNTRLTKRTEGYSYKYVELADINKYCEENGIRYWQEIDTCDINQKDYIVTYVDDGNEVKAHRGCQIVEAVLQGIKNPVQEYGSSLTYCRRYSLLMALGLATEDDDAAGLTTPVEVTEELAKQYNFGFGKHKGKTMEQVLKEDSGYVEWFINNKADDYAKKCYELLTGSKLPTEEEQDERIQLINDLNKVELEYDVPHEKVLEVYKVSSTAQMTVFQLTDAIDKIKNSRNGDK